MEIICRRWYEVKSIALVTDSCFKNSKFNRVANILKKNIEEVFGKRVHVNNYHINCLNKNSMINDDLVLAMASNRVIKIRDFVSSPERIIVAQRTFLKSYISPLFSIPVNTDVLVVNDDIETVLDSMSSLYQIGIKHLNLIPYEVGKDYSHINIAVSPSEPDVVPSHIRKFIDIGDRVLDVSTMLLISNTLKINDKETQQNLYNYFEKIFSTNIGLRENYNNLLTRTEELDYLLDLSNDGILLTSQDGKILIHNKKFKEIFELNKHIVGCYLHDILESLNFKNYYNDEIYDDLIVYKQKYIHLQKKNIIHFNNISKMYFNFQEITYIKKLEQNLSKKLRHKGQIAKYTFNDIITCSQNMIDVINIGKKIANSNLTVLITGESGTGKEVLAQAIHNASNRSKQSFVAINCAAMPDNLLESELFGYISGSFTGALKGGKKGLFEQANNGTIFLDEIGDMPRHLQSKLLRVLQERQIMPIGSDKIIDIDVRIIAATHNNPLDMIKEGTFRKDLFYRLNEFPITIPPLRNRIQDVPLLLKEFTNLSLDFSAESLSLLKNYRWPGNIRELKNIASYITIIEDGNEVTINSLPTYLTSAVGDTEQSHLGIQQQLSIFQNELLFLEEKTNVNMSLAVLKTIAYFNEIKKTSGRKHLLQYLQRQNISLKESQLRKILAALNNIDLIFIKRGRIGNQITEKGKSFLEFKANTIKQD